MPSDTENVKLGVCTVFFDNVDLGFTKGGVEVEVTTDTHEVTVDQTGATPINELITGRMVNVKAPLAETTLQNLERIMPGSTLVAQDGVKASGTVTFDTTPPVNDDSVTIAGTTYTFKTVPIAVTHMAIPATIEDAATALAEKVNEISGLVSAAAVDEVVTITSETYGTAGNAYGLTKVGTNIVVSGANLTGGVNPTKQKVTVKTGVSTSLLSLAKKLVLRPKGTTGAEDFTVHKAMTAGAINFAYNLDQERVYNVTFKGYADDAGNLFSVGDDAAAA